MAEILNTTAQKVMPEWRIAIALSSFNRSYVDGLHRGALEEFKKAQGSQENLHTVWVPGAFELPLAAQQCLRKGNFAGVICLGTIIRGDTPHFDYVCQGAISGIARVSLDESKPVINGIITANTIEQAKDRSAPHSESQHGNLGNYSMMALIDMLHLASQWEAAS